MPAPPSKGAALLNELAGGDLNNLSAGFRAAALRRDENKLRAINATLDQIAARLPRALTDRFAEVLNAAHRDVVPNVAAKAEGILNLLSGQVLPAAEAVAGFSAKIEWARRLRRSL